MTSAEIRKKFLKFFENRGHKIVLSSSLIPKDDPSVLLTTAGMQQFKPYLTGKENSIKDFGAQNVVSLQKSFRTTDIEEVGDESHLTFFEMLGNFSFGGYFKEKAISLSFEFITSPEGMEIAPDRLFVTAFKGDNEAPKDDEAINIWQEQFKKVDINAKIGERIFLYGREKNWWEAGLGPAGPDAEMFYDRGLPHDQKFGPTCHPNCNCGRFIEIGNDVFIQYNKTADGKYEPLEQKSIDNGRGFERLVTIAQNKKNVFETDLFRPIIELIPHKEARFARIIADHVRAATFLIADGVFPSNVAQGYILRRLLRRAIRYGKTLNLDKNFLILLSGKVMEMYKEFYPELSIKQNDILTVIQKEEEKFSKTLERGLREFEKLIARKSNKIISGADVFYLYESFGFPMELTKELASEKSFAVDASEFKAETVKHQKISRAGAEKKFGGHGLRREAEKTQITNHKSQTDEIKITKLHTATHLLHQALHDVLGKEAEIKQMGSDINAERTRFDFTFPRKLTQEELKRIEDIVNEKIQINLPVISQKMPKDKAINLGARAFFKEKYPEEVNVYSIGPSSSNSSEPPYSRELCGGPHVKTTGEIGYFKIIKEESSSAGVRRIRAITG